MLISTWWLKKKPLKNRFIYCVWRQRTSGGRQFSPPTVRVLGTVLRSPPSLCKHLYLLSHYISSMCLFSWDSSLSSRLLCSQEWVSCLHLSNAGSYIPLKSACVRLGIRVCALCGRQAHYWTTTPEYEDGGGTHNQHKEHKKLEVHEVYGVHWEATTTMCFSHVFPKAMGKLDIKDYNSSSISTFP